MSGPFGDALSKDEAQDVLAGKHRPVPTPGNPFGEPMSKGQALNVLELASLPKVHKRKVEKRYPNKWESYTQYRWYCDGCGVYRQVAVIKEKQRSGRRLCLICYTGGRDLVPNWRPHKPLKEDE